MSPTSWTIGDGSVSQRVYTLVENSPINPALSTARTQTYNLSLKLTLFRVKDFCGCGRVAIFVAKSVLLTVLLTQTSVAKPFVENSGTFQFNKTDKSEGVATKSEIL